MKTRVLITSFFILFIQLFTANNAHACYLGGTPDPGISGPELVCAGTSAMYCVDTDYAAGGFQPIWTVTGGTIILTDGTASCITVRWNEETSIGSVVVNIRQPGVGIRHTFEKTVSVVGNNNYISGPSVACTYSALNNVYEVQPSGSSSGQSWTISPTNNVTINGGGQLVTLIFTPAAVGTNYQLRVTGTNMCGGEFTLVKNITVSNCSGLGLAVSAVSGDMATGIHPVNQVTADGLLNITPGALPSKPALFPNPVRIGNTLTLYTGNATATENYDVVIFDVLGKKVKAFSTKEGQLEIDTRDFSAGQYFLHLTSPAGNTTQSFVVQQ